MENVFLFAVTASNFHNFDIESGIGRSAERLRKK